MTSGGRNVVQMQGKRFGALAVLRRAPRTHRLATWVCRCDCGIECIKRGDRLRQGRVKSCGQAGCSWWNFLPPGAVKAHPREYRSWAAMLRRCEGLNEKDRRNYLDRGVKVCERWEKFENFFEDMGKRPTQQHTIDRYPNNAGNYEPGNCRWATKKQQAQNMRTNIFVVYNGERILFMELVDQLKLDRSVVYGRLKNGWTLEEALGIPLNKRKRKK